MDILGNLNRLLTFLGLSDKIVFTRTEPDRAYGWPTYWSPKDCPKCPVLHVVMRGWNPELKESAEYFQATCASFREPGGHSPALQLSFHKNNVPDAAPYFIEADLDYAAPDARHPLRTLQHIGEVVYNAVARRKTDQGKIAELLERRLGNEDQGGSNTGRH